MYDIGVAEPRLGGFRRERIDGAVAAGAGVGGGFEHEVLAIDAHIGKAEIGHQRAQIELQDEAREDNRSDRRQADAQKSDDAVARRERRVDGATLLGGVGARRDAHQLCAKMSISPQPRRSSSMRVGRNWKLASAKAMRPSRRSMRSR